MHSVPEWSRTTPETEQRKKQKPLGFYITFTNTILKEIKICKSWSKLVSLILGERIKLKNLCLPPTIRQFGPTSAFPILLNMTAFRNVPAFRCHHGSL